MRIRLRQPLIGFASLLLLASFSGRVNALPDFASIEGHLEDHLGRAANGRFKAEIRFFMTETSSTPLARIRTKIRARSGHFRVIFMTPDEITALDQAWFTLAIDTNGDGLDEDDLFEDRFRIGEFGQAAAEPLKYFSTHGGSRPRKTSSGSQPLNASTLHVAPFVSPPEGVVFNKMATRTEIFAGGVSSFGIYDEDGDLVVTSGPMPFFLTHQFIEVDVEGVLAPSEMYFTAIGTSVSFGISPRIMIVPSLGHPAGEVSGVVSGGVIPSSFSPAAITGPIAGSGNPISIFLRFEEPAPPTDGESADDIVD